jgi:hypothetical protein
MQYIGRDRDYRACFHTHARQLIAASRHPADGREWRIETERFLDDGTSLAQPIEKQFRRFATRPFCFGSHTFTPFGRTRQQIQCPGDGIGGGFMARGDKGNNVCTNVLPRKLAAGGGVTCADEQHQDIVCRTGFVPLEIAFPCRNHVHRLVKHPGARGEAADAWNKIGKVEKIEGIDSPETIEVGAHCRPQIVSANEQAGGKNGALEHIERKIGGLFRNVEHDTVTLGLAPDQLIDRGHHRRRHVLDHVRSKKRCDQPPLRIPLRAFRRQQATAENGEDPLLKTILAIVCLILLEDPTDRGRIVHNDDVTEWKAGPHNRFFKMSLCPSLYWITP